MVHMGRVSLALGGVVLLRPVAGVGPGHSDCPCINPYTWAQTASGMERYATGAGGAVVYTPDGSERSYTFPTVWGRDCAAHDLNREPYCHTTDGRSAPGWCSVEWCYVDKDACTGITHVKSRWLNVDNLHFSYSTCRTAGSQDNWDDDAFDATTLLVHRLDTYARGATRILEERARRHDSGTCTISDNVDMCGCNSCALNAHWDTRVDFFEVGMKRGVSGSDSEKSKAICMAEEVASNYQAVAAREMDPDFHKIGYMYFGEAGTGGYAQYPKEEFCHPMVEGEGGRTWDPRFRPWYAGGATGPKDVIIAVDVSGSMGEVGRHAKAKMATKLILDTLSWKDFVGVILFNHGSKAYSNTLVPATEANVATIKGWLDRQIWAGGSTSFEGPLDKAFDIIADSTTAGQYSMCQKLIMFMTDGEAHFRSSKYSEYREKAIAADAFIFTYALGSGANTEVPKKLACQNRGIFYKVEDDQDLAGIMGRYFDFFVQGQEICSTNFIKYGHAAASTMLYGACMPMYDRSSTSRQLLGVSCIDVNLLKDISEMQQEAGWDHFLCQATDITKTCRSLDLSDCHLQRSRLAVNPDRSSVCDAEDLASGQQHVNVDEGTQCQCQNHLCQDDPEFRDEKMYFCDTWIGDDCYTGGIPWGYSDAGMAEVRAKCPRSCGLCEWTTCPSEVAECVSPPVAEECRACLGHTSGVDIEGRPMACPLNSPRNLMTNSTTACPGGGCVSLAPTSTISFSCVLVIFMALLVGIFIQ